MRKTDYNFKAPALPYPTSSYDQISQQEHNKILRIYFNQLDASLQTALDVGPYASFTKATSVAFASADTEQVITYDTPTYADGITRGSPTSRIVFEGSGKYLLVFTAQIYSTNSSTIDFYFFPKINGTVVEGSTIKANLHGNGGNTVVSRSAIFSFNADDYLEVACACSSTDGSLNAFAATAFAPATPSTTLAITRISRSII
jgi:hypothetical protein